MTRQTRIRRAPLIVGALALAIGPVGCGTSSPAAPSPPASALITGRVLDGRDAPVAGARVTATDRFYGAIESLSDAAGGFTLTIDVRNSAFAVVVEKDGFEPRVEFMLLGPASQASQSLLAVSWLGPS